MKPAFQKNIDRHTTAVMVLGCLNIIFAVLGLACTVWVLIYLVPSSSYKPELPYRTLCICVMTAVNSLMLISLFVGGVLLVGRHPKGIIVSASAYVSEIVWQIVVVAFWAGTSSLARSAAAASGAGDMGMVPQLIIGYPVSGLLVLAVGGFLKFDSDTVVQNKSQR